LLGLRGFGLIAFGIFRLLPTAENIVEIDFPWQRWQRWQQGNSLGMARQRSASNSNKKTSVTVTEFTLRGKKVWRLRCRINGKVKRSFFQTWAEAEVARRQTLYQLEDRGIHSFEEQEIKTVEEDIKGMTVSKAVRDFFSTREAKDKKFVRITITLPPELAAWVKQKQAELEARDRRLTTSVSAIISEAVAEMRQREHAERLLMNENPTTPRPHLGAEILKPHNQPAGGSKTRQNVT
jgi:hypothetical protein